MAQWWTKAARSSQPKSALTEGSLHKMEPTLNTNWMAKKKNTRLDMAQGLGETNAAVLLKVHSH